MKGNDAPITSFSQDKKECIVAVNSLFGDFMGGPTGAGFPIDDDQTDKADKTLTELADRSYRQKLASGEQEHVYTHQKMKGNVYISCMNSRGWAESS